MPGAMRVTCGSPSAFMEGIQTRLRKLVWHEPSRVNDRAASNYQRSASPIGPSDPVLVVNLLLVEAMVVALPSDHALGRTCRASATIALKDLADETFIIYARQLGPAFYEATMAACLKAGFSPRLGQEAPRITLALSLVAVGIGITLVPACMQRMTMMIPFRSLRLNDLIHASGFVPSGWPTAMPTDPKGIIQRLPL